MHKIHFHLAAPDIRTVIEGSIADANSRRCAAKTIIPYLTRFFMMRYNYK